MTSGDEELCPGRGSQTYWERRERSVAHPARQGCAILIHMVRSRIGAAKAVTAGSSAHGQGNANGLNGLGWPPTGAD